MKSLKQIPKSRYLDDNIVKKLAYLSASFKIFEELCLSKHSATGSTNGAGSESSGKESNYDSMDSSEKIYRKQSLTAIDMRNMWLKQDSICLSKIVDKALVSVASKQMLDSPTNILRRYICNQIRDGHYARVRGKRSDDKDVTVWYDPEKELFFLRAKTYYDELCKKFNLRMTKRQFEDDLAWDNAIVVAERKKGEDTQIRRSHEIKITTNGSKESVLKIRKSVLSSSFASDSVILDAFEKMTAEKVPLRKENTAKA